MYRCCDVSSGKLFSLYYVCDVMVWWALYDVVDLLIYSRTGGMAIE